MSETTNGGQPRDPKGTPTGGQFTSAHRPESDVSLKPEGSFLFPPPLRTPEEIIGFWSSVEIPDQVLAATQAVYSRDLEAVKRSWAQYAWGHCAQGYWYERNPRPPESDGPGALADWEGRQRADQSDYEEALHLRLQTLPETLDRADVRPMCRAVAMWYTANQVDMPWAERKKVAEHQIDFSDGPREVAEVSVETGMAGRGSKLVPPEAYDADGDGVIDEDVHRQRRIVREVVQEVTSEQNQALDAALDEIHEGQQIVAQTVIDANDTGKLKKPRWSHR